MGELISMPIGVVCALIAVSGVIISVIVSVVIGVITNRFNYNQLYAQTVSANRIDWINVWRENISIFLACAETLMNNCHNKNENLLKIKKEMYEARGMVVSRLNLNEEDHRRMLGLMNSFSVECSVYDFVKQREEILELARKILKLEWERVKKEARGKKC